MEKLTVVKIGGNVIDNPENLVVFLDDFASIKGPKVLIHGGGKIASKLANDLGIEAKLIEGRRITDKETLRIVTMVYAGYVNKTIVALLQAKNCNALGLSGADGNAIQAEKRPVKTIDYGFVGDLALNAINTKLLKNLLESGFTPIFSAITHDRKGQLLNTNADTIAASVAIALSGIYQSSLVYCFEKKGVLKDKDNDHSLIPEIRTENFISLQEKGIISDGMIPKLQNAFEAINQGVQEVFIGNSQELGLLQKGEFGTRLCK